MLKSSCLVIFSCFPLTPLNWSSILFNKIFFRQCFIYSCPTIVFFVLILYDIGRFNHLTICCKYLCQIVRHQHLLTNILTLLTQCRLRCYLVKAM